MSLSDIQKILDTKVKHSDRNGMERKMSECLNAIGPAAKLQSKALGDLERKKGELLRKYIDLPYRMLKMRIDSESASEQEEYLLAQRINMALSKTIDGLKSLLSIQSEEGSELKWK
jgi:hypothetical protein